MHPCKLLSNPVQCEYCKYFDISHKNSKKDDNTHKYTNIYIFSRISFSKNLCGLDHVFVSTSLLTLSCKQTQFVQYLHQIQFLEMSVSKCLSNIAMNVLYYKVCDTNEAQDKAKCFRGVGAKLKVVRQI